MLYIVSSVSTKNYGTKGNNMLKILAVTFLVISLCTPIVTAGEKESIEFATSIGMVKDKSYIVGPVWVMAKRSVKDPTSWKIKVANVMDEDIYNVIVIMIFFNDNKSITQNVMKIYEGPFGAGDLETINLRALYKHTHIGFSALIEK